MYLKIGRVDDLNLTVSDIVSISDPSLALPPRESPPPGPNAESEILPGGYEVPIQLQILYWQEPAGLSESSISMTSVRASVQIEGSGPIPLGAQVADHPDSIDWDVLLDPLPDVDAPAMLVFDVEWTDSCFHYQATASRSIQIASTTTTAGCRIDPDEAQFWDDVRAMFDQPVVVGGSSFDIAFVLAEARYLPLGALGADVDLLKVWDQSGRRLPAVIAPPDGVVTVAYDGSRPTLTSMESRFYKRRDVVAALNSGVLYPSGSVDVVFHRTRAPQPDGTFRLRVPSTAGRYVVELMFWFDSACTTSGSRAWVLLSLDVVEPTPSASPSPT